MIARAINFVAPSFSSPGIAMPQNSASVARKAKRLEIVGSRTGGSNLMARCVTDLIARTTQPTHWLYDSWEARAYGSRWVPLGGFEYSRRLTLPPIGFCEDDSKNSVEQRRWDDFAALGGTKIGFWGR